MTEYSKEDINSFLIQANRDVGSHKYKGDQMIPDYCKCILIAQQLEKQLKQKEELKEQLDKCPKCNAKIAPISKAVDGDVTVFECDSVLDNITQQVHFEGYKCRGNQLEQKRNVEKYEYTNMSNRDTNKSDETWLNEVGERGWQVINLDYLESNGREFGWFMRRKRKL